MISVKELRAGNLIVWNPKLLHPDSTLLPTVIEVFSILQDKVGYVFPDIENRVEPFEDDVAQIGAEYKSPEELEPIILTQDIIENTGFIKKEASGFSYFERDGLQLEQKESRFQRVLVTEAGIKVVEPSINYLHQLQNEYFTLTGAELEVKLHGQQV